MDTRFVAEMSVPRTPTISQTKSLIQIVAVEDLDNIVPYLSFDGISPTGPKFLLQILRGSLAWTVATAVTVRAYDTKVSNHAARLATALTAWETNAGPPAEPTTTDAVAIHSFYIHPQGGYVCP